MCYLQVVFHCTSKPLSPISSPPVSNLTIYLKTILKLLPILNSSLMFASVPSSLPGRIEQMPSLKHRKSRKRICFVPAAECRPSVPSKRGRFPSSDRTPCRSVRTPGVVEFCADGPGQPFSNSHGLETIPHSTTHHVLQHFSE